MDKAQLIERLASSVGGRDRLAQYFSARTFGDLNKRAESELQSGAATIIDAVERTEKAIKAAGLEEYWSGSQALENVLIRAWAMYQNAGSRTLNWMITGPARFPVRSNEKRMDTEHKRLGEYLDLAKSAPERALRIARRTMKARVGAGGLADLELADLRQRLEDREKSQARMKGINELIRKNRLGNKRENAEEDAAKLVELARAAGFSMVCSVAYNLLTPDWGKPGFPAYSLSNNNAEINRLRGRVAQVEAKVARMAAAEGEEPAEKVVNGVRIVEDSSDDRLRLIFDGKPDRPVIQLLKGRGFRWSPSNGAWQRQLTPNARDAAQSIVNQISKEAA